MIVVCDFTQYGVRGKKVDELADYLKENVSNTYVKDVAEFVRMKRSIRKKVQQLNEKYPKSEPIEFSGNISDVYGYGALMFKRPKASVNVIGMKVFVVKEFKEGGEQ
jgi:hypothetical protein